MNGVKKAYISLGTNIGDSNANIFEAHRQLKNINGIILDKCSPIYFTEAQENRNQAWFHNQVIRIILSDIIPYELLYILLTIESNMGRIRKKDLENRYGPRIIDLDLLLYDQEVINDNNLCVPHPRMIHRAFVLVPLYDIEPTLCLPNGLTLKKALEGIHYRVEGNCIYQ